MTTTTQQNRSSSWLGQQLANFRAFPKGLVEHQAILFVTAAISIVLDQATKWWVEANIPLHDLIIPIESIGHILDFLHVKNPGAAFGTGAGYGWVFATVAFIVTAGIIIYNSVILGRHFAFRLSLGLIMGGALGNVIDRFRIGEVTDFIHFDFRPLVSEAMAETIPLLNFAIFNLADLSIFSGVGVMFWLMWKDTLPDDPWLDATEEEEWVAARKAKAQREVASSFTEETREEAYSQKAKQQSPSPLFANGVQSGLTSSLEKDYQLRHGPADHRSDWRGHQDGKKGKSGSNARFGLIAGLVVGISIALVIVVFVTRQRNKKRS